MRQFYVSLFFIFLLFSGLYSFAQVHYSFSASNSTYTAITGTSPTLTPLLRTVTDEGFAAGVPIGFNFNYNGTVYTTLGVSTNGFLTLGSVSIPTNAGSFNSLATGPSANTSYRPVIAPLWDDLDIQSVNNLQYTLSGTAPNRVFTMQWTNVKWYYLAAAASISFQAKLFETSNIIQFVYQQEASTPSSGFASIGITAVATGPGNFISLQNTTTSPAISRVNEVTTLGVRPATGQLYTFTPGIYLNDVAVSNVYTLGKIAALPGKPHAVSALITNISGTTFTNLNVTLNVSGVTNFTNVKTIASLAPGVSTVITFDEYTASATGVNTVVVSTPADNDVSNNSSFVMQTVTANRVGYPYSTTINSGVGSNTPTDFTAKFRNVGSALIDQVTLYFLGGNQPYQATIWDASGPGGRPGTLLWSSAMATSTSGAVNINVSPVLPLNGDFFVGVRQLGTANVLLGSETETPLRTGAFFIASVGSPSWVDLSFGTSRLMIEARFITSLPVTTTPLKGERRDNKSILSWSTLTEQNNSGFEVQHSADGSNFSYLGFVTSRSLNGNSSGKVDYAYEDLKPFTVNAYYRLKQIDNDGKFMYSNTIMLRGLSKQDITLSIYPNPAKDVVNTIISMPKDNKVSIYLTDSWGRIVLQKSELLIAGDNTVSFNVANLSSGKYNIKAVSGKGNEVTKTFIKIK